MGPMLDMYADPTGDMAGPGWGELRDCIGGLQRRYVIKGGDSAKTHIEVVNGDPIMLLENVVL